MYVTSGEGFRSAICQTCGSPEAFFRWLDLRRPAASDCLRKELCDDRTPRTYRCSQHCAVSRPLQMQGTVPSSPWLTVLSLAARGYRFWCHTFHFFELKCWRVNHCRSFHCVDATDFAARCRWRSQEQRAAGNGQRRQSLRQRQPKSSKPWAPANAMSPDDDPRPFPYTHPGQ